MKLYVLSQWDSINCDGNIDVKVPRLITRIPRTALNGNALNIAFGFSREISTLLFKAHRLHVLCVKVRTKGIAKFSNGHS